MCVAIVCKPGAIVPNDRLYAGWVANKDGAGFAYVKDGRVVIEKGFMTYNPFQKAYQSAAEKYSATSPFLVHMRIRTSGRTDKKNTHPFKIRGGAVIHNGIMFYPSSSGNNKDQSHSSDTKIFASKLHNILLKEDVKAAEDEILFAVGRTNKLCFLYDDGDYVILNEKAGNWKDDIWYSNYSCDVRTQYTRTSSQSSTSSNGSVTPSGSN